MPCAWRAATAIPCRRSSRPCAITISALTCSLRTTGRTRTVMTNSLSAPAPREMQTTAQEIFRSIQSEMDAVEEEFERQARSNIQIVMRIGQYLRETAGKRVRPALLILAAEILREHVDMAGIHEAHGMGCL